MREALPVTVALRRLRLEEAAVVAAATHGATDPECTCARHHSVGGQGRHARDCAITKTSAQRRAKRARKREARENLSEKKKVKFHLESRYKRMVSDTTPPTYFIRGSYALYFFLKNVDLQKS